MKTVRLEDNKDYLILDTIKINDNEYVYLAYINDKDKKEVCIRKVVDNGENLVGLDSEEEYKVALNVYAEKYKDVINQAA